jgi:hypothetical protein
MKTFWTKLIGFALVVTVAFAGLAGLKYRCSHLLAPKSSGISGAIREQRLDYLFLGSSHTRQSYDIDFFQKRTGKSAFAVAYNGLSPVVMDTIVRYLEESHRLKVGTYLLEAYVYSALKVPALEDTRLFFDSPPDLKAMLLRLLSEKAPSFDWRRRYELLALANNEAILTYPVSYALLARQSYRGGYTNKVIGGLTPEEFERLKSPLQGAAEPSLNPEQVRSLQSLFEFIKARGLRVVFIEAPLPKPVGETPFTSFNKRYLGSLIKEAGFIYLDGDTVFEVGNPDYFADNNHLSTKGRQFFTEKVVDFLSRQQPEKGTAANDAAP